MTWLFLGDSFTASMAAKLIALFLSVGQHAIVKAHVGWSTTSWLENDRAEAAIQRYHPDFVVYALGTNDASGRVLFQQHVRQLLDVAGSAVVFWVGPFGSDDTERGRWVEEVVKEQYIDGLSMCQDLPRGRDGLHLTNTGYKVLAERLANELLERAYYLY